MYALIHWFRSSRQRLEAHRSRAGRRPNQVPGIIDEEREDPALRAKLPDVLRRLAAEVPILKDDGERQSFDCPLLDGDRCLVHRLAKPIGCLAWNSDKEYSKKAWAAFEVRDELNDSIYGRKWQLRVIPLWLKRVFRQQLRPYLRAPHSPPSGETVARHGATVEDHPPERHSITSR